MLDGLADFNRSDPADVAYEHEQNGVLDRLAAGGRQCHHH